MEPNNLIYFGFGYNGFGQLKYDSDRCIYEPHLFLKSKNLLKVCLSWSSISWIEGEMLNIRGSLEKDILKDTQQLYKVDDNLIKEKLLSNYYHNDWLIVKTECKNVYLFHTKTKYINLSFENCNQLETEVTSIALNESKSELIICYKNNVLKYFTLNNEITLKSCLSCDLKVKVLAAGNCHNVILTTEGKVYSWGTGSRGELGHGNLDSVDEPKLIESLDGIRITSIAAGGWHNLVLSESQDVYSWGWNESGQTGLPAPEGVFSSSVQTGSDETCGMLTVPTLLELEGHCKRDASNFISITDISCGSRHSAVVTDEGELVTWGRSIYGQLAHECCVLKSCSSSTLHPPKIVSWFKEKKLFVVSVECGFWSTIAICKENK